MYAGDIVIRGFKQCQHCGDYAPHSDFTLDDRECDYCIRDQQEEDERDYERRESIRIGETIL